MVKTAGSFEVAKLSSEALSDTASWSSLSLPAAYDKDPPRPTKAQMGVVCQNNLLYQGVMEWTMTTDGFTLSHTSTYSHPCRCHLSPTNLNVKTGSRMRVKWELIPLHVPVSSWCNDRWSLGGSPLRPGFGRQSASGPSLRGRTAWHPRRVTDVKFHCLHHMFPLFASPSGPNITTNMVSDSDSWFCCRVRVLLS